MWQSGTSKSSGHPTCVRSIPTAGEEARHHHCHFTEKMLGAAWSLAETPLLGGRGQAEARWSLNNCGGASEERSCLKGLRVL